MSAQSSSLLGNIYDGKVMYYREDCHRDHNRHPTWVSNELRAVKLFPLRGRKIILFPDTDPDGKAYALWYGIAQQAQRLLGQPVTVSPLLELNAAASSEATPPARVRA